MCVRAHAREREGDKEHGLIWPKLERERFIPGDLFGGIVYGPGSSLSRALAAPFLRYNCRFRARSTRAVLFCGGSSVPSSVVRNSRDRILLCRRVPPPLLRETRVQPSAPFFCPHFITPSSFLPFFMRRTRLSPSRQVEFRLLR